MIKGLQYYVPSFSSSPLPHTPTLPCVLSPGLAGWLAGWLARSCAGVAEVILIRVVLAWSSLLFWCWPSPTLPVPASGH